MARGALEPATGIEPAFPPWEGGVLPLDDADRSPLMSLRRPGSAGVVLTPGALREGPGRGRNVAGGYGTDRPYVVGERRPAELSSRPGGRQTRSLSLAPEWRAVWESNLTRGLCWPPLRPARPSAPAQGVRRGKPGKSQPRPFPSVPASDAPPGGSGRLWLPRSCFPAPFLLGKG